MFLGHKTAQPLRHHGKKLRERARDWKRLIREVAANDVIEGETRRHLLQAEVPRSSELGLAAFTVGGIEAVQPPPLPNCC